MRLDRVRIEGFLGHVDTDLDLRTIHTAVITGAVGSGKSSIIDAVTWCLYGEARGRTLDQLIHEGAEMARVRVRLTVGENHYQVTRSRRRGHDSSLLVERGDEVGWLSLTSHTNAETEASLIALLGVEYGPLLAGPFMLQSDTGALMRVKAAARKQLLLDLTVGGDWDRWAAKAKDDAQECSYRVQSIDERLRPLDDVESRLGSAQGGLAAAREEEDAADMEEQAAYRRASDAMARLAIVREQAAEISRLTAEQADVLPRFQKARATAEELQRKMLTARDRHGAHVEKAPPKPPEGAHDDVKAQRVAAMTEFTDAGRALSKLDSMAHVRCPVCSADVVCPNGHPLAGPDPDSLDFARLRARQAQLALGAIDDAEQHARMEMQRWEQHIRIAEQLAAEVRNLDAQAEAAKPLVVELAERGKAIQSRLDELGTVTIETLEREIKTIDEQLAAARARHRAATAARQDLVTTIAGLQKDVAIKVQMQTERAEADRRGDIAAVLAKAFGRDGVPTLMLESTLPVMEARANEVLARMPGGMRLQLRTQRETQKATLHETLDVVVVIEGHERDYELLSGGQRFRVDLALRLGLTQVLSKNRIGTLIVDEGFDRWQDPEGRQAVLDTLTAVSQDFERVLVVSHHPEVQERIGTRIEVTMKDGVSHVQ